MVHYELWINEYNGLRINISRVKKYFKKMNLDETYILFLAYIMRLQNNKNIIEFW